MGDDEALEAWNARRATIEPLSDEQLANLHMTADIGYQGLMPAPLLVAVLKRLDRAEAAVAKVRALLVGCDSCALADEIAEILPTLPPEGPAT